MCLQEHTNYHFGVRPEALLGALDRFAQFFVAPLCKADALEREVQAVDNEFTGAVLGALSTISLSSCVCHPLFKRVAVQRTLIAP